MASEDSSSQECSSHGGSSCCDEDSCFGDINLSLQDVQDVLLTDPFSTESMALKSLWKDSPVVLCLFRRFGCKFCRHSAVEISKIKPFLDETNVRLVAIGFDTTGLQSFVNGGYFAGELLLDEEMKVYTGLRLNRLGFATTVEALMNPKVWKILKSVVITNPIPGDFEGDGMQLGAVLVIDKGGEVMFEQKQRYFGEVPSQTELKAAVLKCRHISRKSTLFPSIAPHPGPAEDGSSMTMHDAGGSVAEASEEFDLNDDSGFLG